MNLVRLVHRSAASRRIARWLFRGVALPQRFFGGRIFLDAIEHSWAWTGTIRYETFDIELQDRLLSLSREYPHLIDIGCNIGAMSLSVLLRNPAAHATCIDANARALALLHRSRRWNHLSHRMEIMHAAVAESDGEVRFVTTGSVVGHVGTAGDLVRAVGFSNLLTAALNQGRCVVKIDVEGFEVALLPLLRAIDARLLDRLCLVVELHPAGFNGLGNPQQCVELLARAGATVVDLRGCSVRDVISDAFTQIVATWPAMPVATDGAHAQL